MDEVKDIEKRDRPLDHFDSRTIRTDAFGHNTVADHAYRRVEKIVAAIHLLTNHLPPEEPLRSVIRQESLKLLSDVLNTQFEMRASESSSLKQAKALIRKLMSLVQIIRVAGHVSDQNAGIIVGALDDLGDFLSSSQRSELSEAVSLDVHDFYDLKVPEAQRPRISDKVIRRRKQSRIKQYVPSIAAGEGAPEIQDRRQEIVGVLGTRGQVGIKDIAVSLPAYSEKMIQRELKSLVTLGRVKKMGAKRWSTYALAQ